MGVDLRHGGNREAAAARLNCPPSQLLDASASLVPWSSRWQRIGLSAWRDYPDRSQVLLRERIGVLHGVEPSFVLPGNGAAELFTWAARDAAEQGLSVLAAPGFADYKRALRCWSATSRQQQLPLLWDEAFPQPFPDAGEGSVLWICNPHNPTGQLWCRASLQPLLERYALVICDEAFLPLVPNGEQQSLIPLVAEHSNLVVIRSLTKLYGIAGLRIGLCRCAAPAVAALGRVAGSLAREWHRPGCWRTVVVIAPALPIVGARACSVGRQRKGPGCSGSWRGLPGITPMPSAANYLLIRVNRISRSAAGSPGATASHPAA